MCQSTLRHVHINIKLYLCCKQNGKNGKENEEKKQIKEAHDVEMRSGMVNKEWTGSSGNGAMFSKHLPNHWAEGEG